MVTISRRSIKDGIRADHSTRYIQAISYNTTFGLSNYYYLLLYTVISYIYPKIEVRREIGVAVYLGNWLQSSLLRELTMSERLVIHH
jgi:hypothetical protein